MNTNIYKKGKFTLITFFLFLLCCIGAFSQVTIPNPSIYLAFDTDNPGYESVSKHIGLVSGTYQQVADRFGNSQRAVKFTNKGAGVRCSGFSINAVHTVSFWINITDPSEIPVGPTPFAATDTKYEIYNWTDANNFILRGIGRRKATIGFNRFIPKSDGTRVPWYLWSYKPAQFNEMGWYHVFIVYGLHYTRLIMYKPSMKKAYSYIWLGGQDFSTNRYLYVGGFGENFPVNSSLDDFKLYNAELTDDQIDFQHIAEYPNNAYVRIQNQNSGKNIVVANASLDNYALIIQNSTGSGNDEWKLSFIGINECKIQNLRSGRILVVKDGATGVGAEIVQYDERGSNNEIWILEYSTLDTKYFRLKNKNSGKYLGVVQNSKAENSKLTQVNTGENSLYWTFLESYPHAKSKIDLGVYRIKNKKSGLYLTILDRSTAVSALLVQHSRFTSGNDVGFDTWVIEPAAYNQDAYMVMNSVSSHYMFDYVYDAEGVDISQGGGSYAGYCDWQFLPTGGENEYRMRNAKSYYYAVVKDSSTGENAHVVKKYSNSGDNEIWILERVYYSDSPLSAGTYKIRNINSYKLMVVRDASKDDGADIIQYNSGTENAKWEIIPADYGFVQLRNKNSQKYLVVRDASLAIGEGIIQHGTSSSNSYWTISKEIYTESGTEYIAYTLKNKKSGLYAVVQNASGGDGAPIIQYNTGEKNKLWAFERQSTNALTRSFDSEQESIASDFDRPEVMIDCKNDIILLDYPFESSTELIIRIMDLTGRQVYEGKKQVNGGSNVVSISQFNSALNVNQFYVVSIRSADGKVNCSTKAIMSK